MTAFTPQEQQRIKDTVAKVELTTSGEIVPIILPQADSYTATSCRVGALIALAVTTFASWWHPELAYWSIALTLIGSFILATLLLRALPAVRRYCIGREEINFRVEEQALASFVRHGLHHTRDATGILILVCMFERRVQVLADRGINEKVAQQQWDDIVMTITSGLKSGNSCDALCSAIEKCGTLVAPHFKRRTDDTNELPDLIHH
jgi:putative membrane protein